MKIDLPDDFGGNVISLEVARESMHYRRLQKTCAHMKISIDPALSSIRCRDCNADLNPVEWLAMLTEEWSRVNRLILTLSEQKRQTDAKIQELEAKSKVKCQYCGRFTLRRYN